MCAHGNLQLVQSHEDPGRTCDELFMDRLQQQTKGIELTLQSDSLTSIS